MKIRWSQQSLDDLSAIHDYIARDSSQNRCQPPIRKGVVGDSFETDVLGANRAGIRGIWFDPSGADHRESALYTTVRELTAVPAAIDRFRRAGWS